VHSTLPIPPALPEAKAPLVLLIELEAPASESGFAAISLYALVAVAKVTADLEALRR